MPHRLLKVWWVNVFGMVSMTWRIYSFVPFCVFVSTAVWWVWMRCGTCLSPTRPMTVSSSWHNLPSKWKTIARFGLCALQPIYTAATKKRQSSCKTSYPLTRWAETTLRHLSPGMTSYRTTRNYFRSVRPYCVVSYRINLTRPHYFYPC